MTFQRRDGGRNVLIDVGLDEDYHNRLHPTLAKWNKVCQLLNDPEVLAMLSNCLTKLQLTTPIQFGSKAQTAAGFSLILNGFRHTQRLPHPDDDDKKKSLATFTEDNVTTLHPAHQLLWSAFHIKDDDTEETVQKRQGLLFSYMNNTLLANFKEAADSCFIEANVDDPPVIQPMPPQDNGGYNHNLRITPNDHFEFVTTGTVKNARPFPPKQYKLTEATIQKRAEAKEMKKKKADEKKARAKKETKQSTILSRKRKRPDGISTRTEDEDEQEDEDEVIIVTPPSSPSQASDPPHPSDSVTNRPVAVAITTTTTTTTQNIEKHSRGFDYPEEDDEDEELSPPPLKKPKRTNLRNKRPPLLKNTTVD